jgi:hypothetical protein
MLNLSAKLPTNHFPAKENIMSEVNNAQVIAALEDMLRQINLQLGILKSENPESANFSLTFTGKEFGELVGGHLTFGTKEIRLKHAVAVISGDPDAHVNALRLIKLMSADKESGVNLGELGLG